MSSRYTYEYKVGTRTMFYENNNFTTLRFRFAEFNEAKERRNEGTKEERKGVC